MEVLDVLNLGEYAQYFSKMAMFPVFDLAYYIVSILYLKYEPGKWNLYLEITVECCIRLQLYLGQIKMTVFKNIYYSFHLRVDQQGMDYKWINSVKYETINFQIMSVMWFVSGFIVTLTLDNRNAEQSCSCVANILSTFIYV